MKRAIFSLAALAALSLAACGGGDDAVPADQTPGNVPEQAQPADPGAADPTANAVPPAEAAPGGPGAVAAEEESPPPTGGYGGGKQTSYATCMTQSRQAGGEMGKQIAEACKRLPDAPK